MRAFVVLMLLALLISLNEQEKEIRAVRAELRELRGMMTATQDSILANVKQPVWWR